MVLKPYLIIIILKNKQMSKFPENFFWGCATSAHQIEGGLINDWTQWENSPQRLKNLAEKQLDPLDFISGKASNSFVENNADINCLKQVNANAYRFSIDWSRIEPQEEEFDEKALEYYKDFILKLRSNNIEPFVTLWHWPLPLWLKGGWENKETIKRYQNFVTKVANYFGDQVKYWITLNEPTVYISQSYLVGEWPPQKRSLVSVIRVFNNLVKAHHQAYLALKKINLESQVGIASHNIYFEAKNNNPVNKLLKKLADWGWNELFLNKIKQQQDFIGLNYYFHNLINFGYNKQFSYENKSDLDWGLCPEGINHVLRDLKKYHQPIYITENGLADKGDQHRSWYIKKILENTQLAMENGVDVRGYFHWSLIDNFEWAHGFEPRFGLFEVNYQTFERVARPSAEFYADICKNNRI